MKKVKKRFWVLSGIFLAMLAACLTTVLLGGKTLTLRMDSMVGDKPVWIAEDPLTVYRDGIIRLEEASVDENNVITVRFASVSKGYVRCVLHVENGEEIPFRLYVDPFGTVIDLNTMNFTGYRLSVYSTLLALLLVAVVSLWSYIECATDAAFSYSMVAYGGVFLFSSVMFIVSAAMWILPDNHSMIAFLTNICNTGVYFVLLSAPLMLLLCAAFACSNLSLIRHEGFRPVNLLGIALGVIWTLGFNFVLFRGFYFFVDVHFDYGLIDMIYYAVSYLVAFMICLLASTMLSAFIATKYHPPYDKDYLIILGCGIRGDGSLTPLLRGRVDRALRFEREQYEATGKHAKLIPSGGQGPDEVISESEAMKRYLLSQGVPGERILQEDRSVNTLQNMAFSRAVMEKDAGGLDGVRAAFSTTNYHIFRGYVLAGKTGIDAQGLSARTRWYFFPNAFLREFIGLIADKKWKLLAIMLLTALVFTMLHRSFSLLYLVFD